MIYLQYQKVVASYKYKNQP